MRFIRRRQQRRFVQALLKTATGYAQSENLMVTSNSILIGQPVAAITILFQIGGGKLYITYIVHPGLDRISQAEQLIRAEELLETLTEKVVDETYHVKRRTIAPGEVKSNKQAD